MATITKKEIDQDVLRAINYLETSDVSAFPKTITSFLMGKKASPYYNSVFAKHEDVCGIYSKISEETVAESLFRLYKAGYLIKTTTPNGRILYLINKDKIEGFEVGGFFKVTTLTTHEIVFVGKIKKITYDTIVSTNGKEYAKENCSTIDEKTYKSLKTSDKLNKSSDEKAKSFYETATETEKSILDEFRKLIKELLPDHEFSSQ